MIGWAVLQPAAVIALAAWAALAPQGPRAEVLVSAAVSLTEALTALARAYERSGGDRLVLNFGASSALARQIVAGAPVDVFISADQTQMDLVERAGLVEPGTRAPFLANELVIVVPDDSRLVIRSAKDLLAAGVRRIAIGDPVAVPAGVYARQYLERQGVWAGVQSKLAPAASVRAALAAVESAAADAAIVYRTDARVAKRVRVAVRVPATEGPPIVYPVAIVRGARHPGAARKLVAFLGSADARRILDHHGFELAGDRGR